jgi:3-oxoacyl-[acyl-carrier protein] reductase
MSSARGTREDARTAYAAAKAALIGMTRTWRLEVADDGIPVKLVAPGRVAHKLSNNGHPLGPEKRQRLIDSVPVRRVGTPDDVARRGLSAARS